MIFVLILIGLILEGWLILELIGLPKGWLRFTLALPISALTCTLIIFILTIFKIPLTSLSIIGLHLILIIGLLITRKRNNELTNNQKLKTGKLINFLPLLLIPTLIYAFTHSILLPTFHYDSATNWNQRSQISFLEKQIAFDTHEGLIKKPHYPFLYHALQITTHQLQPEWNDRLANTIHFLFNLSALIALLLITKSALALVLIVTTPLFAMHLGGGYADVTLTLFALLSFASYLEFKKSDKKTWIIISAIFISACVWTKSEGLVLCLIPWILMIGFKKPALIALSLSLLWPIFAIFKGISLSPHGATDLGIGLQPGAITEALKAIFISGSIGPILPIMILFSLFTLFSLNRSIIFPITSLILILAIYTLTPNAEYLLNGQSFDRQLLLPTALLILALTNCLKLRNSLID